MERHSAVFLLAWPVRRVILRDMMKRQRITLGGYVCHVPNWASGRFRIPQKAGNVPACEKKGPQTFSSP